MSPPVEDDWILDEAEDLLNADWRRERLELVVAGLQTGVVQPISHVAARDRVEKRIGDSRTQ
jgi:hypothetical protein